MATGQIPTWSEAVAAENLPASGELNYFWNTDRNGNLYSIDSSGNIEFVSNTQDCCTCCLSEKWMNGLNEALATGGMTAAEYNAAIAQGFVATSTNDGEGNCTVTVTAVFAAPTSVVVEEATKSIDGGSTGQLHGHVLPAGADQRLLWVSANPSIASVDQTGLVTTYSTYTTVTITAYSVADPTKSDTCVVSVTPP